MRPIAPTFYYRGGRYLKVELQPAPGGGNLPSIKSIEGDPIHANAPAVGRFSCLNDLYNKIHTLIRWAQLNNMLGTIPSNLPSLLIFCQIWPIPTAQWCAGHLRREVPPFDNHLA